MSQRASGKPDCSAIRCFKADLERLLILSEEKQIWLLNISNGFLNAINETWGKGKFLSCFKEKKYTIHLSLSQIRELL